MIFFPAKAYTKDSISENYSDCIYRTKEHMYYFFSKKFEKIAKHCLNRKNLILQFFYPENHDFSILCFAGVTHLSLPACYLKLILLVNWIGSIVVSVSLLFEGLILTFSSKSVKIEYIALDDVLKKC